MACYARASCSEMGEGETSDSIISNEIVLAPARLRNSIANQTGFSPATVTRKPERTCGK